MNSQIVALDSAIFQWIAAIRKHGRIPGYDRSLLSTCRKRFGWDIGQTAHKAALREAGVETTPDRKQDDHQDVETGGST